MTNLDHGGVKANPDQSQVKKEDLMEMLTQGREPLICADGAQEVVVRRIIHVAFTALSGFQVPL